MEAGETKTLKEAIYRPIENLWKMSTVSEIRIFLSGKVWIMIKKSKVKAKGSKPVPMKWVFQSKKELEISIPLK